MRYSIFLKNQMYYLLIIYTNSRITETNIVLQKKKTVCRNISWTSPANDPAPALDDNGVFHAIRVCRVHP